MSPIKVCETEINHKHNSKYTPQMLSFVAWLWRNKIYWSIC